LSFFNIPNILPVTGPDQSVLYPPVGSFNFTLIREERLIEKFGEIVKRVTIDEKIVNWTKEALRLSHKDKREYHDHQIKVLQTEYNKLQKRIDKIYIDKLDEIVTDAFYQKMTNQWKQEQEKLLEQLKKHHKANTNYFETGN